MDPKILKQSNNALLQTGQHGLDISSIVDNIDFIEAKNDPSITEQEIDSFIGQDASSSKDSSLISHQQNSGQTNRLKNFEPNTTSNFVNKFPSSGLEFFENKFDQKYAVISSSSAEPNAKDQNYSPVFFNLDKSEVESRQENIQNQNHNFSRVPYFKNQETLASVRPSGPANTYRIGNLRKPIYAPPPNLNPTVSSNSTLSHPVQKSVIGNSDIKNQNFQNKIDVSSSPFQQQTETASPKMMYHPVYHHWFWCVGADRNSIHQKDFDSKSVWKPFSMSDSLALESAVSLPSLTEETIVATDGGRYDVNVMKREKFPVYWEDDRPYIVRRCSWFYKRLTDNCYVPYVEEIASKLEELYKVAVNSEKWERRLDVGENEEVVMYSINSIIHQYKSVVHSLDEFSNDSTTAMQLKPRIVKRGGFDEFDISDGEPEACDHLLFLIHGIGQFCDLKFRSIIEVVDEFRNISMELVQAHFQEACEMGQVNRIEILPISWHKVVHNEDTGIDSRLKNITLPSIPRLRGFSNDTIMDVLLYNSPVYCQVIINAVCLEMNKLYALFTKRNPKFSGKVSVGGHSLGSLIVFDLLSGQSATVQHTVPKKTSEEDEEDAENEDLPVLPPSFPVKSRPSLTRRISFVTVGSNGVGQPYVKYPRLHFHPRFFFAFGSPTGGFLASRSSEILGENFKLPTCQGFFNIFHPYDPIAYRIEPLIVPSASRIKPIQIPHHKGRKRMHLELKETVTNVGHKLFDTVKNTWNMMYQLTSSKISDNPAVQTLHHELDKVLGERPVSINVIPNEPLTDDPNIKVGCINEGKRVDYVLQEAPHEYINEYLFAITSHLCYWTSRDTMLMVLREIYGDMDIACDNQIRCSTPLSFMNSRSPSPATPRHRRSPICTKTTPGVDPTMPMKFGGNLVPPPMSGFMKK